MWGPIRGRNGPSYHLVSWTKIKTEGFVERLVNQSYKGQFWADEPGRKKPEAGVNLVRLIDRVEVYMTETNDTSTEL